MTQCNSSGGGGAIPPAVRKTVHTGGRHRVLVTKRLAGRRWLEILSQADCCVDLLEENEGRPLTAAQLIAALERQNYAAAIGQLSEPWNADVLECAARGGLRFYSSYAVGYDNVDVAAATRLGILVGNTPGVLTETTAELAVALTFAAARRVAEMDRFTRAGGFVGWLPELGMGHLLEGRRIGVVGAGRIGCCYAEKMAGVGCSILYYSRHPNAALEDYVNDLGALRVRLGRSPVTCRRAESLTECLETCDVVSLHVALTEQTRALIGREQLARMKPGAILINTARGPVVDEHALVEALKSGGLFAAGLDVFEKEPRIHPGLYDCPNAVLLPHVGSASTFAREGMAILAAANIRGMLAGYPPCKSLKDSLARFLGNGPLPESCPSIVNQPEK